MTYPDEFHWCVTKLLNGGRDRNMVEISCKLGLWSVETHDLIESTKIAYEYWKQYYAKGEYDEYLRNPENCKYNWERKEEELRETFPEDYE